jgi:hypothetical protein
MRNRPTPEQVITETSAGKTATEIAYKYGTSERTIERVRAEIRTHTIPMSTKPYWDTPPSLFSDGILLTFDYHIEYHKASTIELALRFQDAWDIPDVYIGGDFSEMEFASPFIPDAGASYPEENKVARGILKTIASGARKVTYSMANHEARLEKMLKRNIDEEIIAGILDVPSNVSVTQYHYVAYNNTWILGHPSRYSKRVGIIGRDIVNVNGMNTAIGHGHQHGTLISDDGKHLIGYVGMMADRRRLSYIMRALTGNPLPQEGFAIIKKNPNDGRDYFYNISPEFMDIEALLKLYA